MDVKSKGNGKICHFTYDNIGYTAFKIPIVIFWKKDTGKVNTKTVEHDISFEGKGASKTIAVEF